MIDKRIARRMLPHIERSVMNDSSVDMQARKIREQEIMDAESKVRELVSLQESSVNEMMR